MNSTKIPLPLNIQTERRSLVGFFHAVHAASIGSILYSAAIIGLFLTLGGGVTSVAGNYSFDRARYEKWVNEDQPICQALFDECKISEAEYRKAKFDRLGLMIGHSGQIPHENLFDKSPEHCVDLLAKGPQVCLGVEQSSLSESVRDAMFYLKHSFLSQWLGAAAFILAVAYSIRVYLGTFNLAMRRLAIVVAIALAWPLYRFTADFYGTAVPVGAQLLLSAWFVWITSLLARLSFRWVLEGFPADSKTVFERATHPTIPSLLQNDQAMVRRTATIRLDAAVAFRIALYAFLGAGLLCAFSSLLRLL